MNINKEKYYKTLNLDNIIYYQRQLFKELKIRERLYLLPSNSAQSICKYLNVWRHRQIKYCQTRIKGKEFEPMLYKDYVPAFCSSFVGRYEEMNLIDICLFKLMEQIQHIYENKSNLDYADGEVWFWLDDYIHKKKPTYIEFIKDFDNED